MTDDELDRALSALPLEEPPADLRGRILAATVYRAPATFRTWELWLLAFVVVVVAWATYEIFATSPGVAGNISDTLYRFVHSAGLFSVTTYLWLAIGISITWWFSSLPFMLPRRTTVYNR
jgi:hypothetical protein